MTFIFIILMSVKVAVRVHPFSKREKYLNSKLCVDMIGNTTRLYNQDAPEKNCEFVFDHCFWSHDQYNVEESGYFRYSCSELSPQSEKYADQQYVFKTLGVEILNNAWEGYNCCLFAYGQTASGKTYSILGQGANKGIFSRLCEQVFSRIEKNNSPNRQYKVYFSMLEIYNQKVQDLMIPANKRPKQGYKIREHKTRGIYVQGLSKQYVGNYGMIEKMMAEGRKNRSIGLTQMNACSGRAHTIISIDLHQIYLCQNNHKKEIRSTIHLVDLAGSERIGKTGATGQTLKQASSINKSLSVLGLVISGLAEKEKCFIPYRDSCLTRILQNSLEGYSKITMLCTISPALFNYEQTFLTLKFAEKVKRIKNKPAKYSTYQQKVKLKFIEQKKEFSLHHVHNSNLKVNNFLQEPIEKQKKEIQESSQFLLQIKHQK